MKLYVNTTSPFVRLVRMAVVEKGLAETVETAFVDAWADAPDFLDANPAGRVPALVTDEGVRLTEALLIIHHLEALRPEPSVLPTGRDAEALSRAGLGINVFDASVSVIIGRKSAADFDGGVVGQKRFRTMRDGLAKLDAALPPDSARPFDLGDMAAVTALDYAAFRFPDTDWRAVAPRIAALRDREAERPAVKETVPRA